MLPETQHPPAITVCILTWNEERNISGCLRSLVQPVMPLTSFEIIVVDNGSADGTRKQVEAFREAFPRISVRWTESGMNHLGNARRIALETAVSPEVAFIDADCSAPEAWVDRLHGAFLEEIRVDSQVAAVGGGNVPPAGQSPFHASLAAMLSSFWGSMGSVQAGPLGRRTEIKHLSTCNVVYDRSKVLDAGNFSGFFPRVGEDLEISCRLRAHGHRLVFRPALDVVHYHRPSLIAWLRKMFVYGRAQPRVSSLYPALVLSTRAIPLLALIAWTLVALLWPRLWLGANLVYVFVALLLGYRLARDLRTAASGARIASLLAVTHFGYAAGEAYGVLETAYDWIRYGNDSPRRAGTPGTGPVPS